MRAAQSTGDAGNADNTDSAENVGSAGSAREEEETGSAAGALVRVPDAAMVPAQERGAATASPDARLLELWLHGRSPHTRRAYQADALRFCAFVGHRPLPTVGLADVQAFADHLAGFPPGPTQAAPAAPADPSLYKEEYGAAAGPPAGALAPATRSRILSSVKSLLAFGHGIGYLSADAGAPLRLPPLKGRLAERILPEPDVQRLLALETSPRDRALLRLLYAAGLRVSEVCQLTWRDTAARGDAGQVTVLGKGGKTRAVLLSAATWREVAGLREQAEARRAAAGPDDPVFVSRKRDRDGGRHLDPSQVLRIVRRAARRAGLEAPVSPHWMRHAHASHALDRGAPIHLVQQTLGHASVATTGRYLHARPTDSSARYLGV